MVLKHTFIKVNIAFGFVILLFYFFYLFTGNILSLTGGDRTINEFIILISICYVLTMLFFVYIDLKENKVGNKEVILNIDEKEISDTDKPGKTTVIITNASTGEINLEEIDIY